MTHTTPSQPADASSPAPTGVRIASTICWVVGILTMLVTIAIGIPTLRVPGGPLFFGVNIVAGAAVCVAAILIRRQRRLGVLIVLLAWAVPTLVTVLNHKAPRGSLLLLVGLLFVGANWKHFH